MEARIIERTELKEADPALFSIHTPSAMQERAARARVSESVARGLLLTPPEIASRIGPSNFVNRQAAVLTSLLSTPRLGRLAEAEKIDPANAYPLTEYLGDLKADVWGTPGSGPAPDENRRTLLRSTICTLLSGNP